MVVSFQGDHRDQESDEVPNNNINGGDSSSSVTGGLVANMKQEEMTESASQKHALSERNRRKRINEHYDSLRQLFPKLVKTDKASVLAETVRHLKELENMLAVITPSQDDGDWCSHVPQPFFIPSANDEISVYYFNGGEKPTVRAVICCDNRPDLNQALTEAIHSVNGKPVKAEMATVGGRTKVDVVVEWPEGGDREEDVGLLRRGLKAVVENQVVGRIGCMVHGSTEPEFYGLGRNLFNTFN